MVEVTRQGRKSSKPAFINEVKRLYLEERWSLGEIAVALPPSIQTLSRWLKEDGVVLQARPRSPNAQRTPEQQAAINAKVSENRRGKGKGPRPGPRETRTCVVCPNQFECRVDSVQRFCSRSCARTHEAEEKHVACKAAWYASVESLCACKVNRIPYEHRHEWRYCSGECRLLYGGRRRADPDNYATLICANRSCGKTFQRYKKRVNGVVDFCSNECARTHTKTARHYVVRDLDVVVDNGWEAMFVGQCAFLKIPATRFDRAQGIEWAPGHWYGPDFLVTIDSSIWAVEVKGVKDPDDEARWAAWRAAKDQILVVLDRARLETLRKADKTEWPALFGEWAWEG